MWSRIRKLHIPNAVDIFKDKKLDIWLFNTSLADSTDDHIKLLSDDELRRLTQFKHEENRQQFAVTRSMLRQLLGKKLGCSPSIIEFSYTKTGRPVISYPMTSLRFSVSHCSDITLYALAENTPIGIDIERDDKHIDPLAIAETVFCGREFECLESCDQILRNKMFYRIWTIKESVLKMLGTGFSMDPCSFCVDQVLNGENIINLQSKINTESIEKAKIIELQIDDQHTATLALAS